MQNYGVCNIKILRDYIEGYTWDVIKKNIVLLLCADGQAQGEIKDRAEGFVFVGNCREILWAVCGLH